VDGDGQGPNPKDSNDGVESLKKDEVLYCTYFRSPTTLKTYKQ
jgi:hypothetical protein